ncbi:hypothetical protein PsAD2_01465 [Pseudovibrio axinellae]|uniref:Type IV secretion system protein n=1 Tax=Pseudovibrio axinellae TaxID=989403 RepID=A0A165ZZ50_9HYPH|nr:hypothetical protein [Pseudovibrio axinellae]KZL20422.1 hypothetical protein PsAD2_01465 [Pseudovibrio axinellae]SER77557.1 Type IV secretion system protein [Pseudovibrio axinellae]
MRANRFIAASMLALSLALISVPAFAARPVIDIKAIAEAKKQIAQMKEQIKTLKEQLDVVKDVRSGVDDTLKSIGEVSKISIPSINFSDITGQIMSDNSCLVPDFEGLMPDVSFDEMDMGSLCSRSDAYQNGLVAEPKDMTSMTWEEKGKVQAGVKKARVNTVADASFKGLAQADMAQENAVKTLEAAQELKSEGAKAQTVNERLQVLIEVNSALLQSQSQTNQLLAQLLKVSSAQSIVQGVPIESELAKDDMKKKGGSK